MKEFAFISRHKLTDEQRALAKHAGVNLTEVGDANAFDANQVLKLVSGYSGAVVVHPAAAMILRNKNYSVGVFEKGSRANEGEKPSFIASQFHIF